MGLRTCVLLMPLSFETIQRYFPPPPTIWQSLPQGIRILLCQTAPQLRRGLAGWMDPPQTCGSVWWMWVSGSGPSGVQWKEICHCIQPGNPSSLAKARWDFFFFEPVCKPLERILSKYVQLDQADFVVKREFIRKYSENNKHHWEFLGSCPWIYEFML